MGAKRNLLTLHKKIAKRAAEQDAKELEVARMRGDFHPRLSITEKLAGAYVKATRR